MTPQKRMIDIILALLLVALLSLPALIIAGMILIVDGRPIFYGSNRMKSPTRSFRLWKFRTMHSGSADQSVSGGYKSQCITRSGRRLRQYRLDEIPQLFNILMGDMSFVGPRPPLPRFVHLRPAIYANVLKARPGITGLATLLYHQTEERLLRQCLTVEEADAVYIFRCIPDKARLDLLWAQNPSSLRDLALLARTIVHVCRGCRSQTSGYKATKPISA